MSRDPWSLRRSAAALALVATFFRATAFPGQVLGGSDIPVGAIPQAQNPAPASIWDKVTSPPSPMPLRPLPSSPLPTVVTVPTGNFGPPPPAGDVVPAGEIPEGESAEKVELRFPDLSLQQTDPNAFIEELRDALRQLGVDAEKVAALRIKLREGSIIAEVRGAPSDLAEVASKPLDQVSVMGSTAQVLALPEQAEEGGEGNEEDFEEDGGEGEEEETEEEEEEDEKERNAMNAGISVMLLGSVVFVMALYELTNCYKESVRKNTWLILSATISIFSAVLIFQGVYGVLEAYVMEGMSKLVKLLLTFLLFLLWFVFLQVLLGIICGVLRVPEALFDPKFEDLDHMKRRVKTFGVLLGHIAGFASIMAWCDLQQEFRGMPWVVLSVAPISWIVINVLGRVTDAVREHVSLIGDGKKDENEDLWDEVTEETEDDIVGLTVSFSFVIGMRYIISGVLPNAEGEEPIQQECSHSTFQMFLLLTVGLGITALEAFRVTVMTKESRLAAQAQNITGMSFSWSIFFCMDWYLSATVFQMQEGMMKQVVLALCVTCFAFLMILALIRAEESEHTGEKADRIIRAIVNSIGILIGFAWERAFDEAVKEVAGDVPWVDEPITKLVLGIVLVSVVAPSWYRHLYPTILRFQRDVHLGEGEADILEEPKNRACGQRSCGLPRWPF